MKKIKSISIILLSLILLFSNYVTSFATNSDITKDTCNSITSNYDYEISYNEEKIIFFEDGSSLAELEDGSVVYRIPANLVDAEMNETRGFWTTIATIIWTTVSGCATVEYVTGHDVCRIFLSLVLNPTQGVEYTLTGNYISGYIPGCQPQNSLPCNQGYWEYIIT